jgi:hypothetical protein
MMLVNEQAGASQGESHILHPGSRTLFRTWDAARHGEPFARRDAIDLKQLRQQMASLFLIERAAGSAGFRWRLAGTGIADLFRRDLTGQPVLAGWDRFERNVIERFLNGVAEEFQPCVLRFRLQTDNRLLIGVEMLALPVTTRNGAIQIFGGLFPFRETSALGYAYIAGKELSAARGVWTEHLTGDDPAPPPARPSPPGGFRPFQVIPGGRT